MKITLEELRNMDDSEFKDDDHPFKKDITEEEFLELVKQSVKESKKIKPKNPISQTEWKQREQAILDALNNTENPC